MEIEKMIPYAELDKTAKHIEENKEHFKILRLHLRKQLKRIDTGTTCYEPELKQRLQ